MISIENDGEHFLFVVFVILAAKSLELKDGIPVTKKEDKKNHGLGSQNMAEASQRSGGSVNWREEEGQVITEIMLPV